MCLCPTGAVTHKLQAMFRFIYRKLLGSGSFSLRRVFLAAVLLYMLFFRLDPGSIKCPFVIQFHHTGCLSIQFLIGDLYVFSLQPFHLHSFGFPNFFSCSDRCGGPCLRRTIRLSIRAKNCKKTETNNKKSTGPLLKFY